MCEEIDVELTLAQLWAKLDKVGLSFNGATPCFRRYSLWAFKQSNWYCSMLLSVDVGTGTDSNLCNAVLSAFRAVITFEGCLILSCSKRDVVSSNLGSDEVINWVEDDCERTVVLDVIIVRVTVEEDEDPWTVLVVTLFSFLYKLIFKYYIILSHYNYTNRLNIIIIQRLHYLSQKVISFNTITFIVVFRKKFRIQINWEWKRELCRRPINYSVISILRTSIYYEQFSVITIITINSRMISHFLKVITVYSFLNEIRMER